MKPFENNKVEEKFVTSNIFSKLVVMVKKLLRVPFWNSQSELYLKILLKYESSQHPIIWTSSFYWYQLFNSVYFRDELWFMEKRWILKQPHVKSWASKTNNFSGSTKFFSAFLSAQKFQDFLDVLAFKAINFYQH